MSNPTSGQQSISPLYRTERVIASLTMAWVIILTTYMIFQNHDLSYTSIYFLKIILALSGAVMLATLPGFFDLNYSIGGFSIRAAGGAAAFIFIYTQSPNLPTLQTGVITPQPTELRKPNPPDSGKTSALFNSYPASMALSFSPVVIMPAPARPSHQNASLGIGADAGSSGTAYGPASRRISLGHAIFLDLSALGSVIRTYGLRMASILGTYLDIAAERVRDAINTLISLAQNLLGLSALTESTPQSIGLITEDPLEPIDELTTPALDAAGQLLDNLAAHISAFSALILQGLSGTTQSLSTITNKTVSLLLNTVETSSQALLNGTENILAQTTSLLGKTPIGEVTGLAEPLTKAIETAAIPAARREIGTITGIAQKTASGVLDSINSGLNRITNGINAVSPGIVSRLDPEILASESLTQLTKQDDFGDLLNDAGKLDALLDQRAIDTGPQNDRYLLRKIPQQALDGVNEAIGNNGVLGLAPSCISGCGETAFGATQGLSALGQGGSNILGGSAIGQLGNQALPKTAGTISSTANTTGSIASSTLGKLRPR